MNELQRIFMRVFPRPHRRVRWQAGIPLVLFTALFALVCFSILPTFVVTAGKPHLWEKVTIAVWDVELVNFKWLSGWNISKPEFEIVRELEYARPWAFLLLLFTPWVWWMH